MTRVRRSRAALEGMEVEMMHSLTLKARRRYSAAKIEFFEAKWGNPRGHKKAAKRHAKLALHYDALRAIAEGLMELEA